MRYLKGFGRFWFDFLIGDDWKIAAAVVAALVPGFMIVRSGSYDPHVLTVGLAVGLALAFTIAMLVDTWGNRR